MNPERTSGPRPRRSQPARDRILRAARQAFGAEGFERTTVRAIAALAAVNPAMVIRYYGSKEGLFAAAVSFELGLPDLRNVPRAEIGEGLVAHFLARWEGTGSNGELQVLLRAGVSHAGARDKLVDIFRTQLTVALASVIGPREAGIRAGLVASQMLGLALARYVLRLPEIAAADRAEIVAAVGPAVQRYISDSLVASLPRETSHSADGGDAILAEG